MKRVKVTGDLFHGQIPEGSVYIGRAAPGLKASPYANPHTLGTCRACGDRHLRSGAVKAYRADLNARPDLIARARQDLAGRDLACWCRPEDACHGDVLLEVLAGDVP